MTDVKMTLIQNNSFIIIIVYYQERHKHRTCSQWTQWVSSGRNTSTYYSLVLLMCPFSDRSSSIVLSLPLVNVHTHFLRASRNTFIVIKYIYKHRAAFSVVYHCIFVVSMLYSTRGSRSAAESPPHAGGPPAAPCPCGLGLVAHRRTPSQRTYYSVLQTRSN